MLFKKSLNKSVKEKENFTQDLANQYEKQFLIPNLSKTTLNLGLSLSKLEWTLQDEILPRSSFMPNALYLGNMGSGKTIAMKFSLMDYYLRNMDNTVIFLVDPLKGATDYDLLKKQSGVISFLNSVELLIKSIDIAYEEMMFRRNEFNAHKIDSIENYNLKIQKLSRVILAIEEAHFVFEEIDYLKNYNIDGTPANKLHTLVRVGRSYGIQIVMASQKVSVIPTKFISNMADILVFKMREEENALISDNGTPLVPLKPGDHGKFNYAGFSNASGLGQFPAIGDEIFDLWLKKYHKPSDSSMLYNSLQGIKDEVKSIDQQPVSSSVTDSLKMKISSMILQYRVSTQLPNKDLAQRLKIDEGNLSKIISGEKKNLDKISLDSLLKHLEVLAPHSSEIKKMLDTMKTI